MLDKLYFLSSSLTLPNSLVLLSLNSLFSALMTFKSIIKNKGI